MIREHNRQINENINSDLNVPHHCNVSSINNQNHEVVYISHRSQTLNQELFTPEEIAPPPFIHVDEVELKEKTEEVPYNDENQSQQLNRCGDIAGDNNPFKQKQNHYRQPYSPLQPEQMLNISFPSSQHYNNSDYSIDMFIAQQFQLQTPALQPEQITAEDINSLTNSPLMEEEEDYTYSLTINSLQFQQQQTSVLQSEDNSFVETILPDIAQPPPLPYMEQLQSILQMHQAEVKQQQQSRINSNNVNGMVKKRKGIPRKSDKSILEDGKTKRKILSLANSNRSKKIKKSEEEVSTISSTSKSLSLDLQLQINPYASESKQYAGATNGFRKNNEGCEILRKETELTIVDNDDNVVTKENTKNRRSKFYETKYKVFNKDDVNELISKKIYLGKEITEDDINKHIAYKYGKTECCDYCHRKVSKYMTSIYKDRVICHKCGKRRIKGDIIKSESEFYDCREREDFEDEEKNRLCDRLDHYAPFYQFIEYKKEKGKEKKEYRVLKTCRYCRQMKQFEYDFKKKKEA